MAGPPVAQNATPTGDTRYDITKDPGAVQIAPGQWRGSDGVLYQGDDPGMVLGDRPNVLDPNLTDWRGGGGGGVGSTSDSALLGNPYFQQAKSAYEAESTADRASTIAAARRLLAQFGFVPQGFNDQLGILDDTTRKLIEQNTASGISQYARLLEGKDDARRATIADLASRGLGRSGARGFKLRRGALDFDRGLSDAIAAVLGNVEEGQSGFASRELQRKNSLSQFLANLAQNFQGGGGQNFIKPSPTPEKNWFDTFPDYSPQQALQSVNNVWQQSFAPFKGGADAWAQAVSAPIAPGYKPGQSSPWQKVSAY